LFEGNFIEGTIHNLFQWWILFWGVRSSKIRPIYCTFEIGSRFLGVLFV